MADSDREILVRIDERTKAVHEELIGGPGRKGRVPQLEEEQAEHTRQIAFWKGAIALVGFLVLAFGALFLGHVLASGGK